MADSPISSHDFCLAALRDGDRDRYLCALLTPEPSRAAVSAIYAFNLELARVRDNISEPMMGEVRLQWWRDLLGSNPLGDIQANPIAAALLSTIEKHQLAAAPFLNMIEARQFDLYDDPMPDRNAFEGYAGETASAVIQLTAQVLSPQGSRQVSEAAGHAGVAQLIAGSLLLMPLHRARGQIYLPADILRACGLDRDSFLAGGETSAIAQSISGFVALGREHLDLARKEMAGMDRDCFPAFLPVSSAQLIFDKADKNGTGQLSKPVTVPQWRRQLRFWRSARRGQI